MGKGEFTDLVLSWSPKLHILDHNLYRNQLEMIPEAFESIDQYFGTFALPLLEETRAELALAMETISESTFAELTYLKESKASELVYIAKAEHWESWANAHGGELHITLPGDVLLLTDLKPQAGFDIQRVGHVFKIACVENTSVDEGEGICTAAGFKLKMAEKIEIVQGHSKSFYVVYLMNLASKRRAWNALRMRRNTAIIEKDAGNCELCPLKCISEMEGESTLFSKLNVSQLEAVVSSLSKAQCIHKSSAELICCPPGTGKKTTLSSFLYILLTMKTRTVICAPTNTAITELASRVISLVRSSVETESKERSLLPYSLGDMLIFGNKDDLKVGLNIEEIFLDDRVERLGGCFTLSPLTGWRHCVVSMLGFLEGCGSQHQRLFINEISKSNSGLEFVREQFSRLAMPLRNCMLTLLTHLPRSLINEQSFRSIDQLLSLMDSMEMLLSEDNSVACEKLEAIFLQQEIIGSEPIVDIKRRCVAALRAVMAHLDELCLPICANRSSIEEFCFQKASLVFCITSSAYKLHSLGIGPFSLLVIDGAAKVKEIETIIALQIPYVKHAIMFGDEKQPRDIVRSRICEKIGFGRSLFERISPLGHSKHLLNMQYMMHPSISRFPNSHFYLNQILDAPCVQSQSFENPYLHGKMFGPYSFINICGGKEELDDIAGESRNMVEVAVVMNLVQKLFKSWNGPNEKLSIGLLSPYAAQVTAIQDRLQHKYKNLEGFTVDVDTVGGFQGGEKDIIIISTVRSYNCESKGSLLNPQSTNFALTRARRSLWILGDEKALCLSDSIWDALIRDAKHRQCFFTAEDDSDISKTVVNVKQELEDLEDLLGGESMLFKNSRWKVLFSDSFLKSFQKLKSSNIKRLAIGILLKLASGWRRKNVNVDWPCKKSTYIVKQFKVVRYFIVCSVDLRKEFVLVEQVLKVWDILPMAETPKLLGRIESISALYTADYIHHCNEKLLEGKLEVPKSWPLTFDIIQFKNPNSNKTGNVGAFESELGVEKSKVSESLLLMKFYSLSTGIANYLLTDLEGRELDLPFEVTSEERDIIMFPRSSFILGRSGTGKTTILTMKLFQKFQHYCLVSRDSMASDNFVQVSNKTSVSNVMLRQLFVTVSPQLCYAVKKHVSQLKSLASGNFFGDGNFFDMDDVDDMAKFKDIPDTFVGIKSEKYPLVITFHKFLMMLDGTLGNSYFDRLRNVGGKGKGLVDIHTFIRKNEVTFDRFQSSYWPHMNAKLTKNLDPSRVFTEIISHIKGSMDLGKACGILRSRQYYISLSNKRVSTLSAENREMIYDMFESYEKMKLKRGEFDVADFVVDIHDRLNKGSLLGEKMDFIYIDEVQDLTMRQIYLFKYLCNNVDEGFVFSGDTAQTIARGIDFRFEDIRSLFYKEFYKNSGRKEKGLISETFCLSQNFRTHTGVLRLAQSVIDLICHFFPQSIDSLDQETSLVYGEPPLVLEPGSDENMIITIFGRSGNSGRKWVGFGANQVILVRDDSARREISGLIGHKALILTIAECKGLEFQDVLLYNFFGSSPLSDRWRLLYEFMKEKDLCASSPQSFPSFGHSKHNILCSELKQLYVAITRTRQRLWICENNDEFFKPMLDYWKSLFLVKVRKVDDSLGDEMQSSSSPTEWRSQGIKLFWEKNYNMATVCFENAGEEIWGKRAKASGLRAAFDRLNDSNPNEARIMLREAAEIFDSINRAESAAECFYDLGEYEKAGKIYMDKCGPSELRKAGDCFTLAQNHKMSAQVYAKGSFYKECLSACTKGKYFELGLQYIEGWRNQAKWNGNFDKTALDFLNKCPLELFRTKDNASLTRLVRALPTMQSKHNFLMSLDRVDVLFNLEDMPTNEAAEIAESVGDIPCAFGFLEKAGKFEKASLLVLSYVLSNSLWVSDTQGWPLKAFPQKEELLTKAMTAAQKVSGTFHASVCAEAEMLTHERRTLAELMQAYCACRDYKARMGEFLSIRKLLDAHFQVSPSDYEWDHELHINPKLFNEIMLSNKISGGTLLYAWNLWKGQSLEILDCMNSLDLTKCHSSTVQLCFDYFGVSLSKDSPSTYVLLNKSASWVRNVEEKFKVRSGKVVTLDASHFVSAARNYWCQDFVSVGFRVLEALQGLYKISVAKPLSAFCQSFCLICIFDVTKFFLESKSLGVDDRNQRLQVFLQLSTKYFSIVFPLDPCCSLSANMASLRETELSRNLLEEIISENVGIGHELTHGQIGRVLMIVMGSGKLKFDLNSLYENPPWMLFMQNFRLSLRLDSAKVAQSHRLHHALAETYSVDWRGKKDYISPNCFFYLMERLLILVPHLQGFFFTTKSAFVEYLICLSSDSDPTADFVVGEKSCSSSIFEFVDSVVQQCLFSVQDTTEWITNSQIECEYYFPVLMLRLVMILCLSSLESELSFNVILKLLDVPQIRSRLPREFCEALLREEGDSCVGIIAEAFQVIGDPLVIVSWNESNPLFVCSDAVFVNMDSSCKNDIMKIMFDSRNSSTGGRSVTEFQEIGVPPVVSMTETGEKSNLRVNWGLIREVSNSVESLLCGRVDKNSMNIVQKKKEEMEEHLKFLSDVMVQLNEQRYFSGEDKNELSKATCLIKELNCLFSFEMREYATGDMREIGIFLGKLEASEFQLDVLFSQFSMMSDSKGSVVISPVVDYDKNFSFSGQRKIELLTAPVESLLDRVAECSLQQRNQGSKNRNKARKGKKGQKKNQSLVKLGKADDSLEEQIQSLSSPEEWKSQGIKLFWEKNYNMATICFENAGEEIWGKRAKASGLRAAFDCLHGSNPNEARVMLREAAVLFGSINQAESAAECYYELGEYERAGKIYMEKCGTSELRKAGECFAFARCHKMSAEAYAKGCFYEECLSACTKGKHFELGLQYIEGWRNQESWNSSFDKTTLDFLNKCPLELFRAKDNTSLTRLIQALPTMGSKRNFLMSLDRLDVLLNLEDTLGNFNEAAEIAESVGDIPHAFEFMEKAGKFEKASLLILPHILSNSLWVSGTQGWPLKAFPHKEELLAKAMAAAQKVSGTLHASVCAEAEILSHEGRTLAELMQGYRACKDYSARMGEFLSVRKLLEAHFQVSPSDYEWDRGLSIDPMLFDEIMSSNKVSGGTLLYVWNLWKGQSLEILDCMNSLESADKSTVQFCFNYFGVIVSKDSPSTYVLLNSNASWVRNVDEKFKIRSGKVMSLDAGHFVSAARIYWCQDFVSVGFRVLEALKGLYEISVAKPLSAFCQGSCLICIFDVTKFLLKSKPLGVDAKNRRLQVFLQLSTKYFNTVFPLDPRLSLSENMVSLRETELSQNLLEKTVSENIRVGHESTYRQIGRAVMIVMGSGKLKLNLNLLFSSTSWKSFMQSFRVKNVGQSQWLHEALAETYSVVRKGKKDCISPNCFFYLMERLLILVPHSQGFFFTTKSAFVEHLISLPSDSDLTASFVQFCSSSIFEFVDSVVQHCLFSVQDTTEWIANSEIDCKYYFPVLMLRLVLILCLSSLESELSFNVILKLLNVPQIRSRLPREFCEALLCERKNEDKGAYVGIIAGAFQVIGDPLVIVSWNKSHPKFVCSDVVFVKLDSSSRKNDILKIMFDPRNVTGFHEMGVPPIVVAMTEANEKGNLRVNWGLICEMSDAFLSVVHGRADKNTTSLVQKKKDEMEEHLKFLSDVMAQLNEQRYFTGEDKKELSRVTREIEELNCLFPLEISERNLKKMIAIGLCMRMLKDSEFQLDMLLSRFSVRSDPNGSVAVSPVVDYDKKIEELSVPAADSLVDWVAEPGKRKSQNRSRSIKGKKGGRRK